MAFSISPIQVPSTQAMSGGIDWSPLAKLGEQYREGVKQDKLSALGKRLADGSISYQQAAGEIADMGDVNSTLKFLALSEQEKQRGRALDASKNFSGMISGTPSASETIAAPPSAMPRVSAAPNPASDDEPVIPRPPAPVPNTPIRTTPDGRIAGNITAPNEPPPIVQPPPAVAPPPVAAPTFNDRFGAARPQGRTSMLSGEGPTIADVPRLLTAIANPDLPDAQKEIAKDLYKRAMDSAKPTDKIATLQALRDNPELLAIEKDLRKSSKTDVNILPGEKKQDEEVGKQLGEFHATAIKDALASGKTKANLDTAERAMAAPGFASGAAAPAVRAAQQVGVALGLVKDDTASPNELFSKLQNRAIMDAGGSGSGLGPQISNNDVKIIRDSTYNSTNTPEGNRKIIGYLRLMEDRKVDYAKELNAYARGHGGRLDMDVVSHMGDWVDNHPLAFEKIPGFQKPEDTPVSAGAHKNIPFKVNP